MRRSSVISLLVGALAVAGLTAAGPPVPAPVGGTHVHADGSVHAHGPDGSSGSSAAGLERSMDTTRCGAGYAFTSPALEGYCTHGPDEAPAGVDPTTAQTPPVTAAEAAAAGPLVCDGNGTDGYRAEAIYVHLAGNADRSGQYAASFSAWAATIQQQVADSTVLHDASATPLRYRFVHTSPVDGSCELVVHVEELPQTADDTFGNTIDELKLRGYDDPTRNYLIWMDSNQLCGIGTLYGDSNPDPASNYNNFGYRASYSRADVGCWNYAELHELMHNIGAVQNDAPHSSGGYHCNDDRDVMCYGDGGSTSAMYIDNDCSDSSFELLLDCNGDDYFNPSPPAGSYLAQNWNTANSWWLFEDTGTGGGPVDPGPDPEPDATTTDTFTGSLNKKRTTETFGFSAGAGDIVVTLDDGTTVNANAPGGKGGGGKGGGGSGGDTTSAWLVELLDGSTVLDSATGTGVVSFTVSDASAGSYAIRVSDNRGSYTVTVTHG